MKIEVYNVYNPNAKKTVNIYELLKRPFVETDQVLKYLLERKPEKIKEYLLALKKRLVDEVQDFQIDASPFDLAEIRKELTLLNDYVDLQELLVQFAAKYLTLSKGNQPEQENVEVLQLNEEKVYLILAYHRVKAIVEVLGKEEGVRIWKEIYAQMVDEDIKKGKIIKRSQAEALKSNIKRWCETEFADFAVAVFDDHKVLYRFDRCVAYEAIKHISRDDPEIAYLATCYYGDLEGALLGKDSRMRRTQSLHQGDFCDEFCWDSDVHEDPEQPSLEFTRKLGRE